MSNNNPSSGFFSDILKKSFEGAVKIGSFLVNLVTTAAARLLLGKKEFEREMEKIERKNTQDIVKEAENEKRKNSEKNKNSEEKSKEKEENSHNDKQEKTSEKVPEEKNFEKDEVKEKIKEETKELVCKAFTTNDCLIEETNDKFNVIINGNSPETAINIQLDKLGNIIDNDNEPQIAAIVSAAFLSASVDNLFAQSVPSPEEVNDKIKEVIENNYNSSFSYYNIKCSLTEKSEAEVGLNFECLNVDGTTGTLKNEVIFNKSDLLNGKAAEEVQNNICCAVILIKENFTQEYLANIDHFNEYENVNDYSADDIIEADYEPLPDYPSHDDVFDDPFSLNNPRNYAFDDFYSSGPEM